MLPGLINLDFADVRTTMLEAGDAILGIGMGVGEHRAMLAAEKPSLRRCSTARSRGHSLLLSITGGPTSAGRGGGGRGDPAGRAPTPTSSSAPASTRTCMRRSGSP